jgi:hypothetical protein
MLGFASLLSKEILFLSKEENAIEPSIVFNKKLVRLERLPKIIVFLFIDLFFFI